MENLDSERLHKSLYQIQLMNISLQEIMEEYPTPDSLHERMEDLKGELEVLDMYEKIWGSYKSFQEWKSLGYVVVKGSRHDMRINNIPLFHESKVKYVGRGNEGTWKDYGPEWYEGEEEMDSLHGGIGGIQDMMGEDPFGLH